MWLFGDQPPSLTELVSIATDSRGSERVSELPRHTLRTRNTPGSTIHSPFSRPGLRYLAANAAWLGQQRITPWLNVAAENIILQSSPLADFSWTKCFKRKILSVYSIWLGSTVFSMQTFESVYSRYRDIVLRFAIQCAGRREVAEDLTAEAFLELHRHWHSIDVDRLPSWLFTVVKNRAADHWRRMERERRYVSRFLR